MSLIYLRSEQNNIFFSLKLKIKETSKNNKNSKAGCTGDDKGKRQLIVSPLLENSLPGQPDAASVPEQLLAGAPEQWLQIIMKEMIQEEIYPSGAGSPEIDKQANNSKGAKQW